MFSIGGESYFSVRPLVLVVAVSGTFYQLILLPADPRDWDLGKLGRSVQFLERK